MGILNENITNFATKHPWTHKILQSVSYKLKEGLLYYKYPSNCSRAQYLYWYPSLNAGLPVVNKPDAIHQAIYMFHDMVHTCLYDPLPNSDLQQYIIGKMVGEVTSQLIADGIFATILKSEFDPNYTYHRRYYLPFYTLLKKQPIEQLLIALSYFAIYGDRTHLIALCKDEPKSKKWVHVYCNLYAKMFEADLWWNRQIYRQFEENSYQFDIKNCYPNNLPITEKSIDAIVKHNIQLLDTISIPVEGDGMKLAQELAPNTHMVYEPITVNYRKKIPTNVLTEIRTTLQE